MSLNNSDRKDDGGPSKKKFVSIRKKLMCIYLLVIGVLFVVVSLAMPKVLNQYLLREKRRELSKTRELVDGVLTSEDFMTSQEAAAVLENIAKASEANIWICTMENDDTCRVFVFGDTSSQNSDSIDFSSFTDDEKELVYNVLHGSELRDLTSAFPSAFKAPTLTIGYPQTYLRSTTFNFGNSQTTAVMEENGAVFIHVRLGDIQMMTSSLKSIFVVTMLAVTIVASILIGILGNRVLTPVQQMKEAADGIRKGDFSQEVPVTSNDEIGELEEAFNAMARDLQQVDRLQSDFIQNISHDFRSPLTSIKGYVEAMLDGTIPPDQHDKYLKVVLDEANRLTKMTNNVLDLTKMENGQIELHPVNFDINEMIVTLTLSLEQRIEEKKINMSFQFLQEKLIVNADMDLIERVVYNLLDNALKFTSEGDSISVETSIVGKKAYIAVADTGAGISPEALPHIFDRFNKGDKSRGKNKMGTGLGLAIVKQIIVQHHEDIKVYSKLGEGTRFAFTLPLAYKYNLVEKK